MEATQQKMDWNGRKRERRKNQSLTTPPTHFTLTTTSKSRNYPAHPRLTMSPRALTRHKDEGKKVK